MASSPLFSFDRAWWFKTGSALLSLGTVYALFYFAGFWATTGHSAVSWIIFVFTLLGVERLYNGVVSILLILRAPPGAGADLTR
jgi:hypothetical protein